MNKPDWLSGCITDSAEPVMAGTVVPLRKGKHGQLEVLLLKRNSRLDFAGGSWVFPGGRVDQHDLQDSELESARLAAIREAKEESGLELTDKQLIFMSHWTTPEVVPKRFSTWFFLALLDHSDTRVSVDGSEITEHNWVEPGQALELHREKRIELLPPAFVTLTELTMFTEPEQAVDYFAGREVPWILPKVASRDDAIVMLYPGDAGYHSGEAEADGERHRVVMVPGNWIYENSVYR